MSLPPSRSTPPVDPHRRQRVVAIVGPTAVGKTALAEEIAVQRGGEIVSADSMQVYRGMDVGTAKPPLSERRVPYHCLDLVDPGEPFSAALFQLHARGAIERIGSVGRLPVVAGGTGLYVRAALDGLEFPAGEQQDNPVRAHYELIAAEQGPDALHALLCETDPASAALIHPNNTRRVIRALELHEDGVSYAERHSGFSVRESIYDISMVGLKMDRTVLYGRIGARVDAMMDAGLMTEVERLLADGFREGLTAVQAIGYKELVAVADGDTSLDEAVDAIKRATRRYAKRQLTWFNADPRIHWVDVTELSPAETTALALSTIDC